MNSLEDNLEFADRKCFILYEMSGTFRKFPRGYYSFSNQRLKLAFKLVLLSLNTALSTKR